MKHISFAFTAVLSAVLAFSCQAPEDDPVTGAEPPHLVSSSPEDGAADLVGTSLDLILTFDRNVMCPTAERGRIAVSGGAQIGNIDAYMQEVTLGITGLEQGSTYTVTLPAGTVIGYDNNPAEEISITFTMKSFSGDNGQEIAGTLVTDDPIPAAARLYDYLRSVYGTRTLSGAMAHVNWNTDEAQWIGQCTGKYPAIAFFDYVHLADSPADWIDYGDITPVREWWEAGGLVGAGWHWNVPISQGSTELTFNVETDDGKANTFSAADALIEGTWENAVLEADLEKIADYLMLLQEAGIPVIWRPLHEAAGNTYTYGTGAWFWWGADGADAYVALWRYMFDWFKAAGLRNLIWVWTTQTSSFSDIDFAFYPGDDYVDIVGKDIYNDADAASLAGQFSTVASLSEHKMVTLSELGNVADMGPQWDAGAQWLFFMPWYDYGNDYTAGYAHAHADIGWWTATFASDAVIDRSELPDDLF